jgi:hypothetical protein
VTLGLFVSGSERSGVPSGGGASSLFSLSPLPLSVGNSASAAAVVVSAGAPAHGWLDPSLTGLETIGPADGGGPASSPSPPVPSLVVAPLVCSLLVPPGTLAPQFRLSIRRLLVPRLSCLRIG